MSEKPSTLNSQLSTSAKPWSLRSIKDTRENAAEAVAAAQSVPPTAKSFIAELIAGLSPSVKLVCVDAHAQPIGLGVSVTIHVAPL